jgi:L-alanine-DL-glutamate epimerase-like enolase superfamily enzyme
LAIVHTRIRAFNVPRTNGPIGPAGPMSGSSFITVSLKDDCGLEGIGYAGYASPVMGPALKSATFALAERTIGKDPLGVDSITVELSQVAGDGSLSGIESRAVAAIDIALWDLKGKILHQPVSTLLGTNRNQVDTYASGLLWRNESLDQLQENAASFVSNGFSGIKLRLGGENSKDAEIERVRVVRDAIGNDIKLMVDVNQGWNVNQAITIGRHLSRFDVFWLEDPINFQDIAGLAAISDALDTPIAAGEYAYGIPPFRYMLERRAIDIVMVDLWRAGGITPWMKIAHLAESFNTPIVSHLGHEVSVHPVAAAKNGIMVEHMPWASSLFINEPKLENGRMIVPNTPGIGIELNEQGLLAMEI